MGRWSFSLITLILLLAFLFACTQTPTPTIEKVEFSVIVDPSAALLMEELVAAYGESHSHVTIQLEQAANSERTLEALQGGLADAASVSWLPESAKTGGGSWYQPFARDSIVMVTHPANPVAGLTLPQLRGIFSGQTLSWEEVGGPAVDVIPISREDGSGTRLSFESLVMGRWDVTPTSVVMPSHKAVVEYVSTTPGAVGYVSPAWLSPSINLLAVEGVTPSPASVSDGRYPLARPFYLIARVEPQGEPAQFAEWVVEGRGREIIRQSYALAP
jgi:phosphate transport system substrate-binding protein